MFFLFVQVALITLIHSLSSNLFLVPTLSFTRLFLLLSVCGTASIVPCVLRLLLFHLNGNLLIYAPMGVMSRISSTLLLTCIPCFHANIIKKKKKKKKKTLKCKTLGRPLGIKSQLCHNSHVALRPRQVEINKYSLRVLQKKLWLHEH